MKNNGFDNNQPIPLSFRHPSYTSLHEGDLVTKSGNRVADFTTVEEEENPHVLKFKEMSDKNKERWAKIGYVPPSNLIEMANNIKKQENQNLNNMNDIKLNNDLKINTTHKRCGSFGMELGEAKNKQRISRDLIVIDKDDEDNYYDEEEEEEENGEIHDEYSMDGNEYYQKDDDYDDIEELSSQSEYESDYEEECSELFGRLGIIMKETKDSPIYKAIQTGDLSYIKDVQNALKVLRGYKEECIQNLWIEENSYISEIIYGLEKPLEKNSSQKTERNSYKKQIRFEKEKLKVATEMLNKKYKEEAQKLDEKFTSPKTLNEYSKPSQTLLKLKEKARGLLKENKFDEAKNEIKKVAKLEQKETKKMNDILKQTYFEEDKALK